MYPPLEMPDTVIPLFEAPRGGSDGVAGLTSRILSKYD